MTTLSGSPITKGVAITTTANAAYDMIKQEGRLVSGTPGGSPPAKYLEEIYEIPFAHSLPPAPPYHTTPCGHTHFTECGRGSRGGKVIYENIPGDK